VHICVVVKEDRPMSWVMFIHVEMHIRRYQRKEDADRKGSRQMSRVMRTSTGTVS